MPKDLTRFSYTPETWARLMTEPEETLAALEKAQSITYQRPGS